ncbi:hypothetical protein MKX03_001891 [Papaver bracteatum]|nr:hypothetical protein MKX03_001891 [Papaver bracteatum]
MDSRRRGVLADTNVKYTYDDPSSADSPSDFVVPLRNNIESEISNNSAIGGYSENPLEDDPPMVVPNVDLDPPTNLPSQLHRFPPPTGTFFYYEACCVNFDKLIIWCN